MRTTALCFGVLIATACSSTTTSQGSGGAGAGGMAQPGTGATGGGVAGGSGGSGAAASGGTGLTAGSDGKQNTGGIMSGGGMNPSGGATLTGGASVGGGGVATGGTPSGGGGSATGGASPAGGAGAGGSTGATGGATPVTGGTSGVGGSPAGGSGGDGAGGTATGGATTTEWLPSWGTTIQKTEQNNLPPALGNQTLRQYLWPTYTGSQIRIQLSNEKGTSPVVINKVHIAMAGSGRGQIDAGTDKEFKFSGSANVSIPAGQTVWSDALDFSLQEMKLTAVSIHFSSVPTEITGHPGARTTSVVASGDVVSQASISGETRERWYFIDTIEVMAPADAFAVCLLGDSITDGYGTDAAKPDFARWSDFLTIAIKKDATVKDKVSVINAGMGANSLLSGNGDQDSGLVRYERDCVGRPKVKWDIILEGVNDIGGKADTSLAAQIESAYQQMIDNGHQAGHLVFGSPITPFKGNIQYAGGSALTLRNNINTWVRSQNKFDAVVDLAEAVADPNDKDSLLQALSNDGLHPSRAGYEAMGNAVDLSLFK